MPLESATYIDDLVSTNPAATDGSGQGDDHLRLIKAVLLASFPNVGGAVTLTHTEINALETRADALEAADTSLDGRLDTIEAAYVKKDGSVAFTGDQSMGGNQLTNVGAPAGANDAARKTDVDAKLTSPMTTQGDIITGGASGAAQRLALGSSGQVLTSDGTDAVWDDVPPGTIVQVVGTQDGAVATGTTAIPYDDTIPQKTEGDQYMSRTITPTNASNILEIEVCWIGSIGGTNPLQVALFKDNDADAIASAIQTVAATNFPQQVYFKHRMTAGSTSEITFKVRAGAAAGGTTTFNGASSSRKHGGVLASSITVKEITV